MAQVTKLPLKGSAMVPGGIYFPSLPATAGPPLQLPNIKSPSIYPISYQAKQVFIHVVLSLFAQHVSIVISKDTQYCVLFPGLPF